jgi:hypothetical protein
MATALPEGSQNADARCSHEVVVGEGEWQSALLRRPARRVGKPAERLRNE